MRSMAVTPPRPAKRPAGGPSRSSSHRAQPTKTASTPMAVCEIWMRNSLFTWKAVCECMSKRMPPLRARIGKR